MSARFPLTRARRAFVVRRALSFIAMGALLFFGTMVAARFRPSRLLFWLGASGAVLLVLGLRSIVLGTRPLTVGENAIWVAGRGYALGNVDSLAVEQGRLVIRIGRRTLTEELDEPAMAAAEIARRAGLRPPKRGTERWAREEIAG